MLFEMFIRIRQQSILKKKNEKLQQEKQQKSKKMVRFSDDVQVKYFEKSKAELFNDYVLSAYTVTNSSFIYKYIYDIDINSYENEYDTEYDNEYVNSLYNSYNSNSYLRNYDTYKYNIYDITEGNEMEEIELIKWK